MLEYHAAMVELSDRLLELLAVGLGLPPNWFADKFDESLATLRPLHYRHAVLAGSFLEGTCSEISAPCLIMQRSGWG